MPTHRKAATALSALTIAGALLATAAPAQADGTPSAQPSPAVKTAPAPKNDGAKAICRRLPKTEQRIDNGLARLNGPTTTIGSIARLQQRVDDAKTAGHTDVYTYLNDRLTFRKSLVPTLTLRQNDLKSVAAWCTAQGLDSAPAAQ
ncbi:hypothetical protein GCM10009665_58570 [Kitasatospora nipponensis]|uniref:Hemophore-related protein n=1 Tax=Kitasatospora nipponensis TaxID=258049 RepID=A0ABP4HFS0_9ACTN